MSLQGNSTVVSDTSGRDLALVDIGGGCEFVAANPTAGTGIISSTPITLAAAATAPTMVVYNSNLLGNGPTIYPLWLKLVETAASTGGTQLNFQWHVDTINRYTSGGTQLTPANTNPGSTIKSNAVIHFGAITGVAASNDVVVSGNCRCRVALIDILGDQLLFTFGQSTALPLGPTSMTTATIGQFHFSHAAVGIPPGSSLVFTIWQPTTFTTGVTYEVEFGYAEK